MSVEIVAEIGSNWNGSLTTAVDLIQAAAAAGADTVKFQHYPDDQRYGPHPMTREDLVYLSIAAQASNLGFLCSVFDRRTLTEYVEECSPSRVKIASPELTDHDLLRACVDAGLHIILSTGMSTEKEVSEALEVVGSPYDQVMLLHCVSSYPCPPEEMNLALFKDDHYWDGLSDHSLDPVVAPVAATALGAVMIEKHFTLDRTQDGPDHSYALDPPDFKRMVDAVRLCEAMLGDGVKRVMPSEDPTDRRSAEWRAA